MNYRRKPEYIEKMRRIAIEKGYGKWMKDKKFPLETRMKIKKRMLDNPIKFWEGKHLSENHKKNISKGVLKKKLKHTETFKNRQSERMKKENPMKDKKVRLKVKIANRGKHNSPETEFKRINRKSFEPYTID
jgi:hypothetical protein